MHVTFGVCGAGLCKALGPPLVTLMSGEAEVHYLPLCNMHLICLKTET